MQLDSSEAKAMALARPVPVTSWMHPNGKPLYGNASLMTSQMGAVWAERRSVPSRRFSFSRK
jgi:hypothetical protein